MGGKIMITDLVDSKMSTALLEAIYKTNESMIRNLKECGVEAKQLIGWRNQLSAAISIRRAIECKPTDIVGEYEVTEKQNRDFDLDRKYGN
jgi:hypothetical protein